MPPNLDKIRFAVGVDDGPRSAWWFVRTEQKGDVYVGAQSLGGYMKLSLHRDRWCQLGFTSKQIGLMEEARLPLPQRHYLFRWQRPESPRHGAIHVLSLLVPTNMLNRAPPPSPASRPKFLFAPAPEGHALEFGLFYSWESAEVLERKLGRIGVPMIFNTFDSGETVHFVGRRVPFDSSGLHDQNWTKAQLQPLSDLAVGLQPGTSLTNCSAIFINQPSADGSIRLIDASGFTVSRRHAPQNG